MKKKSPPEKEEKKETSKALLEGVNEVLTASLTSESVEEVAQICLAVAERITESQFGWIGELNDSGKLDTIAISDPGWEECTIPSPHAKINIFNMDIRGIWSRALKDKRSIITNDPGSHPDRVGLPEGHPEITSFMGVPLFENGKLFGMIALGNRKTGYRKKDKENIETLSVALAQALTQKRNEEALEKQNEFLNTVLECIEDGIVACDNKGTLTLFNRATRKFHGLPHKPIPAEKWAEHYDLFLGDGKTPMKMEDVPLFKALKEEKVDNVEMIINPKQGPSRILLATGRSLVDKKKKKTGAVVSMHDITDRKKAEKELKEYWEGLEKLVEERTYELKKTNETLQRTTEDLERMFNLSGSMVCIVDFENGYLKKVSPAFEKTLGHTSDELLSMPYMDLIHPEDQEKTKIIIKEKLGEGVEIFDFEIRCRCKDDSYKWLAWSSRPVPEESISFAIAYDITGRKEAEQNFLQQQYYLQKAQEIGKLGTWELDLEKNKLFWTDETYRIFGIPLNTPLTYEIFISCVHPDDREYVVRKWTAALQGEPYDIEHRINASNGNIKWVREKAYLEFDEKGTALRGTGFAQDISEIKKTTEALKLERDKLMGIMNAMTDGIYIVDRNYDIEYINPVIEREFGEVEGRKCYAYFHNRTEVCPWCKNREVLAGKSVRWEWFSFKNKKYYDLFDTPIRNQDGSISKFEIFHDITNRKQMESEIKKSEIKFRRYFELPPVGMAMTSPEKGWLELNDRVCEIMGYTGEELRTMTWTELTHPDDLEPDVTQFNRVLAGEIDNYDLEKRFIRKDGSIVHTHLWLSCVRNDDKSVSYFIAVIQDITSRKKMEEELIQAKEQAEEATELKDKFVSLVAHDLRGPLSTFVAFLKLFEEDTLDREQRAKLLKTAQMTGKKMFTIIDDLLNISRVKTGKIRPKFSFFDVAIMVKQMAQEFQILAGKKNIQMVNRVKKESRVYADQALLREVVRNLLSNAVKFCKEGDVITLHIPDRKPFTLAVSDTGTGVNPEMTEDLFKYEVKTTFKGTNGELGTGLGLPLSRDIMEAHGGSLTMKSTEGKGSVFYVHLPHVTPRVLVVDDEPMSRKIIATYMDSLKVDIIEAESGEKALESMKQAPPHLVILDIFMPVMDGFELMEEIKKEDKYKDIFILILTSDTDMETRNRAFRMGASDVITKPFTREDLVPRARRFFE